MSIPWGEVISVVLSVVIIVAIAILRQYSDALTAIAAVAPIKVPLGMWVFMSAQEKTQTDFVNFNNELIINIIPTLCFLTAAYIAARNGLGLVPTIIVGYVVWGIAMGTVFGIKSVTGIA